MTQSRREADHLAEAGLVSVEVTKILTEQWVLSHSLILSVSVFVRPSVSLSLSLSKEREREVERERRDREDYNFTVNISHCNIRYKIHVVDKKCCFGDIIFYQSYLFENLFLNSCLIIRIWIWFSLIWFHFLCREGLTLAEVSSSPEVQEEFRSEFCPVPISCSQARDSAYRSVDGSCNNLNNPHWGAAVTPQPRYQPAQYDDGKAAILQIV